jgi:hypothetical protein
VNSRHPARARSGVTLHVVSGSGQEAGTTESAQKQTSFRRYPLWRVLLANGLTLIHYVAGAGAIVLAYRSLPIVGWPVGLAYFVYAVVQLYVLMPLVVCPGCVYSGIEDGRCPIGLSVISARFFRDPAQRTAFDARTQGALCQSNLCLVSLVAPVPLAVPGLILSFSWPGMALTAAVAALVTARLAGAYRRVVCAHCLARRWCPVGRSRYPV